MAEYGNRIHVVACGVLAIDIRNLAEQMGLGITLELNEGGLHENPGELRRRLQASIDRASASGQCDRIAVGYGICGRGTVGIHARNVPLVIPKAHDCIALFLGSDAAYRQEFSRFPGTFYISAGWFEEKIQPKSVRKQDGEQPRDVDFQRLADKYGGENARAIVDFLNSWQRNYQRAAFVDTGAPHAEKYSSYAKAMAEEFGWRYEALPGNLLLLQKMLTAMATTPEVLVVPPHHVTVLDPMEGLKAVPIWQASSRQKEKGKRKKEEEEESRKSEKTATGCAQIGLGIDAGGTYTDAVIYDFAGNAILGKAKALTTKWDYTVGITQALDGLDAVLMRRVDLVSISTTLATNAIVEGHGQEVGLLIMPPYGIFHDTDLPHQPRAVIAGRMEIDGTEISPVNPHEVRSIAREMIERHRVGAFAVSGYASTINPSHELQVKAILREETGLSVTCGHELSELLNFITRADTAVLNARIMPRLEKFIREVEVSLERRGIDAPVMVVKGDGSLMNTATARERPVETVLSGPAASVAGAIHLTKGRDALVLDMGGTTSDTAAVLGGEVRTCPDGAHVGRWKTHVRALDMRTVGLGGDSLIAYDRGELQVGPLRVAPIAWLGAERPGAADALAFVEAHVDDYAGCTRPTEIVTLTGHAAGFALDDDERRIVDALRERPRSVAELAQASESDHWIFLRLGRLEEHYVVQRCGLTPTDLLHVRGQFERWDTTSALRMRAIIAGLAGFDDPERFTDHVMDMIVRKLAVQLIKKQLDEHTDPDAMDGCPVCKTLIGNLLAHSADMRTDAKVVDGPLQPKAQSPTPNASAPNAYRVSLALGSPVIGLGAPVHFFLPQAARLLGTEAIVPQHADVANAIGAITSRVTVSKQVQIRPNDFGQYAVHGLADARCFDSFDDAHSFAVSELEQTVQRMARSAGTSESFVEMEVGDKISSAADGAEIFLERVISARLSGPPDLGSGREGR